MRLSSGLLGFRSRQLLSGCGNPRCAADSASPAQLPLGWTGPVSSAPSVVRSYYNCPATASVGRAWLLAAAAPTSIFSVRSHCSYSQISGSARPSLHSKCLLSATRRTQLRVSAGPLRLASSRALTHERERSQLRLVAASLTANLAFSIPPLLGIPPPFSAAPLSWTPLGIPPPFSAAPLSWIPLGSPPAAKLGSDLPASLGLPSSLEPPANPLSPLLAPVVGKGPSLTSLLSASPPLGPRGLVTSW